MLLKTIETLREPVAALTAQMIYPITCEGAALARDGSGHQRERKGGNRKMKTQVRRTVLNDLSVDSVR